MRKGLLIQMVITACLFPLLSFAQYEWKSVAIGGGGFVSGMVYSKAEKGLLYARTDVGGAFRWDTLQGNWTPITDHIGRDQSNYTGIISLAADPRNAGKVYMATGMYTQSWAGTGAIMISADKGNTWTTVPLSIKLGGNEDGRSAGERLLIDPNKTDQLWLGSNTDGLWRSTDAAASWQKVNSFPVAQSTAGSGGISFVCADPASSSNGNPVQTLYVGVLQSGTTLYRSKDGGATWSAVPGQPSLMPHQMAMASNGIIYLAYSNGPGPNGISSGAVWKLDPTTDTWTALNPPAGQGGYGGISVDPANPLHLLVSTIDRWSPKDEIFRSTDGGQTWKALLATGTWDYNNIPYAQTSTPHWIGDVDFNPFNTNEAWFITGYGVFHSKNIAHPTSVPWIFDNKGLEETVPLKLTAPAAGARLLSAIGDIDGFRHLSLNTSPAAGRVQPRWGTNLSIDAAAAKPHLLARTHNNAAAHYGAYSKNSGETWTAFSSSPAGTTGGGQIAVSADGSTMLWVPAGKSFYYSTDNGVTWKASAGTSATGLVPVADKVNPARFYAFDPNVGRLLATTDGGANFQIRATALPTVPSWQTGAVNMKTVPGKEGHLWLATPQGMQRSTNGGASFSAIAGFSEAYRIGFGKNASNATYPTIFCAGTLAGTYGFYRSTDEGATWTRINNNQNQFGSINDMEGDAQVFGRVFLATGGRGIVYGQPTGTTDPDCSGVEDGTAFTDPCNKCVGGNTGAAACAGVTTGVIDLGQTTITWLPNPFQETMLLNSTAIVTYTITDLSGRKRAYGTVNGQVQLGRNLEPGVYMLTLQEQQRTTSIKIVKL